MNHPVHALPPSIESHASIRSEDVVDALVRGGFSVFRRDAIATILERGTRAVVVPRARGLTWYDLASLRRMAGLRHAELLALLRSRADAAAKP